MLFKELRKVLDTYEIIAIESHYKGINGYDGQTYDIPDIYDECNVTSVYSHYNKYGEELSICVDLREE